MKTKAQYVDGFVLPVPKKNIRAYRKMATEGGKWFIKLGALEFRECVGDDLKGMPGCLTFPKMVKPKPGETVFFSWITYKSRAHRDQVNKKMMQSMKDQKMPDMPFDPKRMAYGGFKILVQA